MLCPWATSWPRGLPRSHATGGSACFGGPRPAAAARRLRVQGAATGADTGSHGACHAVGRQIPDRNGRKVRFVHICDVPLTINDFQRQSALIRTTADVIIHVIFQRQPVFVWKDKHTCHTNNLQTSPKHDRNSRDFTILRRDNALEELSKGVEALRERRRASTSVIEALRQRQIVSLKSVAGRRSVS